MGMCAEENVNVEPQYSSSPDVCVCALVKLKKGLADHILTVRTPEMEVLWRYWHFPLDCYTLGLESVFPVVSDPPRLLLQKRQSRMGTHSLGLDAKLVSIKLGSTGYLWPSCDFSDVKLSVNGKTMALTTFSQSLGDMSFEAELLPAVTLPKPLALLALSRHWHTILHLARWPFKFFPGWPPQSWFAERVGQSLLGNPDNDTNWGLQDVQGLAHDLRRWSSRIISGG